MANTLSHTELSLRGRQGAYTRLAHTDAREFTAPARRGWYAQFERQVDPDGVLPAPDRARRAEAAMRAYMAELAYKSAASRRAKSAKTTKTTPRRYTREGLLIDCAGCARDEGRAYYDNATDRMCRTHLAEMRRQIDLFRSRIARAQRVPSVA